ncbi:MAG: hypothetical protein EOO44_14595 [Flavobacterium sp.]|nr:MAG: hypothetical protein EOO44_14595 [Flavobacterium sp.]
MPNKTEAESSQFKVMDNDSLVSLSEKQKSSFYKQIDINGAIVEKLSDGNFIMLPGYGKKGILFYDENAMEQMIANNVYPKETDTGTLYETYRNEILGLKNKSDDSSITFFEHKFEKVSKMPFDYSFSITFLNKLTPIGIMINNIH